LPGQGAEWVVRANLLPPGPVALKENTMPMTKKGNEIYSAMMKEYGPEKGKQVFYASANKGTIKGVHKGKKKVKHG
jgi:hypothetical protein